MSEPARAKADADLISDIADELYEWEGSGESGLPFAERLIEIVRAADAKSSVNEKRTAQGVDGSAQPG